jgi:hypothetical protein
MARAVQLVRFTFAPFERFVNTLLGFSAIYHLGNYDPHHCSPVG